MIKTNKTNTLVLYFQVNYLFKKSNGTHLPKSHFPIGLAVSYQGELAFWLLELDTKKVLRNLNQKIIV
jgi:hypothetical protein